MLQHSSNTGKEQKDLANKRYKEELNENFRTEKDIVTNKNSFDMLSSRMKMTKISITLRRVK